MAYYACIRANASFPKVFSIIATSFGNVHIEEYQTKQNALIGIVIGQDYIRSSQEFVGMIILLEDFEKYTIIKYIALGSIVKPSESTFIKKCKEELQELISILSEQGITVEILEENPHYFREYGD
ncbi:MAG: hypothetical protein ACTSVA_06165 [Candidatus Njordarchaeales archaeon]